MSMTVELAVGTVLRLGNDLVTLNEAADFVVPGANSLDAVAEILAASNKSDLTAQSNLRLNAALVDRQEVATAALEGGYAAGTALDISYGPSGEKKYTAVGTPRVLVPVSTTIEDAADTKIIVDFDENIVSPGGNYLLGWSCKVATVARTINSAVRGTDQSTVELTLASAVTVGQAVVISYDIALGDIESQGEGGPQLQSFVDAVVDNNVV